MRSRAKKIPAFIFGKNPGKRRSVGFGASKGSILRCLSSSGSNVDEILVDFHGFELPLLLSSSLRSQAMENQILLFQFSLGNNCCRIRGKFHPGNLPDSLIIPEPRFYFPAQKIIYPWNCWKGTRSDLSQALRLPQPSSLSSAPSKSVPQLLKNHGVGCRRKMGRLPGCVHPMGKSSWNLFPL